MKKEIGQVTSEERDEIQILFERRNGLSELAKVLTTNDTALYEKLVKDLGETSYKFQNWWDSMSSKYNWETHPDGHWEIDFKNGTIFLVTPI